MMRDYIKLTKVTSKLYLGMFIVALICMLINTVFICVDYSGVKIGESIEHKITTEISKEKALNDENIYILPEHGLDISGAISDKVYEIGFVITMAGIMILMFIRRICFVDTRAREFELTFPVKKTALVMHEYWFFFLLITGVTLLQGIILAIYQTHYNNVWIRIAGVNESAEFNGFGIEKLYAYVGIYILSLLISFTWIFLCVIVCKNEFVGGVTSVVACYVISSIDYWVDFSEIIMCVFSSRVPAEYSIDEIGMYHLMNKDEVEAWEQKKSYIQEIINTIIHPSERLEIINGLHVAILISMLLIGILLVWIAGKKRHLTRGGRFAYFKVAEYLFAVICGGLWFTFLSDLFWYDFDKRFYVVLSPLVVIAIIIYLLNPVKIKPDENRKFITKHGLLARLNDSKRVLIALLTGVVYVFVKDSEMFSAIISRGEYYYYEDDPYEVFSWDMGSYAYSITKVMIIILILSKLYRYWSERKGNIREFYETIPLTRKKQKIRSILQDLAITMIPVVVSGVFQMYVYLPNVIKYDVTNNYNKYSQYMKGILVVEILYLFMLIGLLHLIEEMFVNGLMRVFAYGGVIMMIFISLEGACSTFKHSYIDDAIYNLLSMEYSNEKCISYMVFYLIVGIILFVASVILAKNKELSRQGFYFEFEKYLFSIMIAFTVFMMSQPYVVAMWHRAIIGVACILFSGVLVYYAKMQKS